ncbi:MAG: NAD(P)H-hydrate dehydratase [Bacteroidia bacterium]
MLILSAEQIRSADQFTIANEPISSIDLMERAAGKCAEYIITNYKPSSKFIIVAGHGNNGGDGLVIARLLHKNNFQCKTILVNPKDNLSADCKTNKQRLIDTKIPFDEINSIELFNQTFQKIGTDYIIIDALLGTGLNSPLAGLYKEIVDEINKRQLEIISIDLPTGLFTDIYNEPDDSIVKNALVLTFQFPKLAFFMACNKDYIKDFIVLDIGLLEEFNDKVHTPFHFTTIKEILPFIKIRNKFSHKGSHGHALLIAGSKKYRGAALLSAKSCLRSGAGLLTVHSTNEVLRNIITVLPDAILSTDTNNEYISELPDTKAFDAIGIGPGLGTENATQTVLKKLINYFQGPLVIDADGLNILSENKTWISFLPPNTIITPHPKEFDRLTSIHDNDFNRLRSAINLAIKNNIIIVLKGTYTCIINSDGQCFFNSTGNAGLAKGGSGDVLTGIILGLLARGYQAKQAAILGVYLHGAIADKSVQIQSMESLLPSDLTELIGTTLKEIETLRIQ